MKDVTFCVQVFSSLCFGVVAEPLEQLWNSWSVQTPGYCPNARVL